ncbi:MAG: hypothetical protein EOL86_13250, partial [Deltaproteobacteria bacterium]|nr:hypothetical protein [Deltaproteobacteria bacterium]
MPSNFPHLFSLCAVLLALAACAPNQDRNRLSSTHAYDALHQSLDREHDELSDLRDREKANLERTTPPKPAPMAPELPRYNPLEETRISISVRNEPLNDVLFVVVRNAGLDLVIDPNLSLENRVTVSFENALSSEVVRSLLDAYDVHWFIRDNVMTVQQFEERTFDLEFMNARSEVTMQAGGDIFGSSNAEDADTDLSGTFQVAATQGKGIQENSVYDGIRQNITSVMTSSEGQMGLFSLNPVSGTLYVQTTPRRMRTIGTLVDRLRGKLSKQVIIDAQILEVTLGDGFELGVDWNFVQRRVHNGRGYQYGLGVNPETGLGTRGTSGSALSA